MPTDGATAKFLYTILKQLDLKCIDWNLVASQLEITNGHAARMRFSRFKQHMEGVNPNPRRRVAGTSPPGSSNRPSKKSKAKAKLEKNGTPPAVANTGSDSETRDCKKNILKEFQGSSAAAAGDADDEAGSRTSAGATTPGMFPPEPMTPPPAFNFGTTLHVKDEHMEDSFGFGNPFAGAEAQGPFDFTATQSPLGPSDSSRMVDRSDFGPFGGNYPPVSMESGMAMQEIAQGVGQRVGLMRTGRVKIEPDWEEE
ncbi:MAG: hypothetical protein M1819_006502 [Sarea resinae]|nr:MAG: hypothetical protein M1819_006502 [Sarea resinae]